MLIGQSIRTVIKDIALKTGVYNRTFFNIYPFMFSPRQLSIIEHFVGEARGVDGCFLEAGCAFGATTIFLKKSMAEHNIDAKYYAIDTFSGFVESHVEYEIKARGKPAIMSTQFSENKQSWFDRSMTLHGIEDVISIKSDVTLFDFDAVGPIAFCLLDVDLYIPIRDVLPKIYNRMAPGGVLLVDDCKPNEFYDGAQQAFDEFIAERGLERVVLGEKIGVLRA